VLQHILAILLSFSVSHVRQAIATVFQLVQASFDVKLIILVNSDKCTQSCLHCWLNAGRRQSATSIPTFTALHRGFCCLLKVMQQATNYCNTAALTVTVLLLLSCCATCVADSTTVADAQQLSDHLIMQCT
jgi:hypothetical protein